MSVFDIFSKRQKRMRGDVPDVYVYDKIPQPLRVQIVHIWQDALGNREQYQKSYYGVYRAYEGIVELLRREYGLFRLPGGSHHGAQDYFGELTSFVLQAQEHERVLDAVELSFMAIDSLTRKYVYLTRNNAAETADAAIEELNTRFREHGVGFQYVSGKIIQIDSELIHAEVVKPALTLLQTKEFAGAQAEFLKAHEHYRHGNQKEALAECLKAFESVMKAVCTKRKWVHDPNATSKALIQVCFDNGLIPSFWKQHFGALRSVLESGIPTVRNRLGGHGQGSAVIEVPDHLVAYALHMTASTIVFLVEAERAMK